MIRMTYTHSLDNPMMTHLVNRSSQLIIDMLVSHVSLVISRGSRLHLSQWFSSPNECLNIIN